MLQRINPTLSQPYIRHELASLGVLDPVETAKDGLALLLHQGVDHCLNRPHRGVVRLHKRVNGEAGREQLGRYLLLPVGSGIRDKEGVKVGEQQGDVHAGIKPGR